MDYTYDFLKHHGVKGQEWGIRRYQNEDGSRTNLGRKHERETKRAYRAATYGAFLPSDERPSGGKATSSNTVYGVIRKNDNPSNNIPAKEEPDTPAKSSTSKSSTVGVFKKPDTSSTGKKLKASEVAKQRTYNKSSKYINDGKNAVKRLVTSK